MKYFKRFMPMFAADSGAGGGSGSDGTVGTDSGEGAKNNTAETGTGEGSGKDDGQKDGKDKDPDDFERLLQARLDKAMEEERKKNANLTKEIEKMKREKMTADELKKYDDEKRANDLAEREKTIAEKENRYYAITALKKAGLDDGSETALELAELVMGADTDETDTRIATLNKLVTKMVDSKVNERFKSFGRVPNGGNSSGSEGKEKNTLAEKLGKQRAEQNKKSNDILKHYLGGN